MNYFKKYQEFLFEATLDVTIDKLAKTVGNYPWSDDYLDYLKKELGYKYLGGGSSAEVLISKDGKEILKVFGPKEDPGMVRFLSFCVKNQKNTFVPKIREIEKVWIEEENRWMYGVYMEPLKEAEEIADFKKDLDDVMFGQTPKILALGDNPTILNNPKNSKIYMEEIKRVVSNYSKINEKDLHDLISFLFMHINNYKQMIDFGPQNWMLRGSNQLVLIDPFWPLKD